MGFLGKLKFWKRDDDFNFDELADQDMIKHDNLGLEEQPLTQEKSPFPEQKPEETHPSFDDPTLKPEPSAIQQMRKEQTNPPLNNLDLVNSKLDTIKALLNSLDQRIANLEKSSGMEKKENKLW